MSQFNPKYKIMSRIAIIANWIAWVFLITAFISVIDDVINFDQALYNAKMAISHSPKSSSGLFNFFYPTISVLMSIINSLTNGMYSFLILKAVSLGLFMLIEIDLDIKLLKEGAGHE